MMKGSWPLCNLRGSFYILRLHCVYCILVSFAVLTQHSKLSGEVDHTIPRLEEDNLPENQHNLYFCTWNPNCFFFVFLVFFWYLLKFVIPLNVFACRNL